MPTVLLILVQVATAVALGAAVGLERELSNQPAGLRTHMLVARLTEISEKLRALDGVQGVDMVR